MSCVFAFIFIGVSLILLLFRSPPQLLLRD